MSPNFAFAASKKTTKYSAEVSPEPYEKLLAELFNPQRPPEGVNDILFGENKGYGIDSVFRGSPTAAFFKRPSTWIPFVGLYKTLDKIGTYVPVPKYSSKLNTQAYKDKIDLGLKYQEKFLDEKLNEGRLSDPLIDSIFSEVEELLKLKRVKKVTYQDRTVPENIAESRARSAFHFKYHRDPDPSRSDEYLYFKRMLNRERNVEERLPKTVIQEIPKTRQEVEQAVREIIKRIVKNIENSDSYKESVEGLRGTNFSTKKGEWKEAAVYSLASDLVDELSSFLLDLPDLTQTELKERLGQLRKQFLNFDGRLKASSSEFNRRLYNFALHDAALMKPFIAAHWWGLSQSPDYWRPEKNGFKTVSKMMRFMGVSIGILAYHITWAALTVGPIYHGANGPEQVEFRAQNANAQYQLQHLSSPHNKPFKEGEEKIIFTNYAFHAAPDVFDLVTGEQAYSLLKTTKALPQQELSENTPFIRQLAFQSPLGGGILAIPSPRGFEVVHVNISKRSFFDSWAKRVSYEDFEVFQDPDTKRAFVRLKGFRLPGDVFRIEEAYFKPDKKGAFEESLKEDHRPRSEFEKKIYEINSQKLLEFSKELNDAGFSKFSKDLSNLVEKNRAQNLEHVELNDLISTFAQGAQYQVDGKMGWGQWFPMNVAERFSQFAMDGKACMQCDGGNSFLTAFLNDYYGRESGIEVRPVVGIPRDGGNLALPLHQQSEIFALGKRVARFDATPLNMQNLKGLQKSKANESRIEVFPEMKAVPSPEIVADRWRQYENEREKSSHLEIAEEGPPQGWKSVEQRSLEVDKHIVELRKAHISKTLGEWIKQIDGELKNLKKEMERANNGKIPLQDDTTPWARKFALLSRTKNYLLGNISKEEFLEAYGADPRQPFFEFFENENEGIKLVVEKSSENRKIIARYPFLEDDVLRKLLSSKTIQEMFEKSTLPLDYVPAFRSSCLMFSNY